MTKNAWTDYSATAASNTELEGTGITGSNLPSNFDNALRILMTHTADAMAGTSPLSDNLKIGNAADLTANMQFDCSGITTATTRTVTWPDANLTVVGVDTAQTLTNKTLTTPIISTISNTGTLTLPTSTDTLVGRATTDTLTNKTLTAPNISQVVFPATQVPSSDANTLDDYEEGTWTPAITFTTPGDLSVTYSAQTGEYIKIGKLVVFSCRIQTSAFTHTTASSFFRLTGFPFTMGTTSVGGGTVNLSGYTKASYTQINLETSASTFMYFNASGSGVSTTELTASDIPTGGTIRIYAQGSYVASA